jgi:hypothetical protein
LLELEAPPTPAMKATTAHTFLLLALLAASRMAATVGRGRGVHPIGFVKQLIRDLNLAP